MILIDGTELTPMQRDSGGYCLIDAATFQEWKIGGVRTWGTAQEAVDAAKKYLSNQFKQTN